MEKEAKMSLKQQELIKIQEEYVEKLKKIDADKKTTADDREKNEKYKKKLEKIKKIIKAQLTGLKKLLIPDISLKRPSSASGILEYSPTMRRLKNNNNVNFENIDQEIEEIQQEIDILNKRQKLNVFKNP